MLMPDFLDSVAESIVELWSKVENDIITEIIRRLMKADYMTPSAQWQLLKAREMGVTQKAIIKIVATATQKSNRSVKRVVEKATAKSLDMTVTQYKAAGLNTAELESSKGMQQIVNAGVRQTNGLMTNFTRTLAKTANKAFENCLDEAWLKVSSGAFSLGQSVRTVVRELSGKGVSSIAYPSGHVDQPEVAARRAVITGVNHTVGEIQVQAAETMGTDLVEVSSHPGARPSHAVWQGGIYSLGGKSDKYKPFRETTGYGTGEGLCGWNCRHSFYPFIEGVSEPLPMNDTLNGKSNDELYAESQRQRELERRIRESKRECAALDTARKNEKDPAMKAQYEAEFSRAAKLLKQRENALNAYCDQTNRKKLVDRLQVEGYNRSVSSKATLASAQYYKDWADSMGITETLPKISDYYAMKNNDPTGYRWLRGYVKAIDTGDISPLVGYRVYQDTAKAITNDLVGTKTGDGVEIKGFVTHFIDRVIGQVADPHDGKRQGVTMVQAHYALTHGTIRDESRRDGKISRIYTSEECAVTMNPETGMLIQTNPRKGR